MNNLYENVIDNLDKQLNTERLVIRPYQEGDEGAFFRVLKDNLNRLDPVVAGRLARVRMLDDARNLLLQFQTDWSNRKTFSFGIWLKNTNDYVGDLILKNFDHNVPKAEASVYLAKKAEAQGYATEAMVALLQFSFDKIKLNKLYMRCTTQNQRCCNLLERVGMIQEGLLRQDLCSKDSSELLDLYYYGITRNDYEQLQKEVEAQQLMSTQG